MSRATWTCMLLALVGCYSPVASSFHQMSQARFAPTDRPGVWGRALYAFQTRGVLIHFSDSVGGVLQSVTQPTTIRCSNESRKICSAQVGWQLTISQDGLAVLRVNRGISGESWRGESLTTDEDVRALQYDLDALVAWIAGAPVPPPQVPAAPAASVTSEKK